MVSSEDIARLNARIDELKEYLKRIEGRVDATYTDMGNVRENMTTRADLDNIRVAMATMATSKDVDRLWKFDWIFLTAIIGLLVTLIIFLLTGQAKP
ncbi:MAG: hypothetical protein O8C63_11420 [Candidatus Methanoperedens sp.]|nr:hypothetical protein [Candidatus Methanoperedens sp.]